jgi:hypothetical protein
MLVVDRAKGRRKKRKRSVYVIARPLKAAGYASFLSDGKFPVCHWGLLVSERTWSEVEAQWKEVLGSLESFRSEDLQLRGTMFELLRVSDCKVKHQKFNNFQLEQWRDEWQSVFFACVGETEVTDDMLSRQGTPNFEKCSHTWPASMITRKYPDYDAYTNNCQNFVLYLLKYACPGCPAPRTIREVVSSFTTCLASPLTLTYAVYCSSERALIAMFIQNGCHEHPNEAGISPVSRSLICKRCMVLLYCGGHCVQINTCCQQFSLSLLFYIRTWIISAGTLHRKPLGWIWIFFFLRLDFDFFLHYHGEPSGRDSSWDPRLML